MTQPPRGPQQPYQGPYPPPYPPPYLQQRRRSGWRQAGVVIGVVTLVLYVIGVATGGSSSSPTAGSPAAPAVAAAAVNAPEATPTESPTLLLKMTATGVKNSEEFTSTGSEMLVKYTYDCRNFGQAGNFALELDQAGEQVDLLTNALDTGGTDTTYAYDGPGTYSIGVNSECQSIVWVYGWA